MVHVSAVVSPVEAVSAELVSVNSLTTAVRLLVAVSADSVVHSTEVVDPENPDVPVVDWATLVDDVMVSSGAVVDDPTDVVSVLQVEDKSLFPVV